MSRFSALRLGCVTMMQGMAGRANLEERRGEAHSTPNSSHEPSTSAAQLHSFLVELS